MFCNQRVQSGERKISEIYENPLAQHSGQWVRWEFLLDQVEKSKESPKDIITVEPCLYFYEHITVHVTKRF